MYDWLEKIAFCCWLDHTALSLSSPLGGAVRGRLSDIRLQASESCESPERDRNRGVSIVSAGSAPAPVIACAAALPSCLLPAMPGSKPDMVGYSR